MANPIDERNDDSSYDDLEGLDTQGIVDQGRPRGYTASGKPKGGTRAGAGRKGILSGGKRSFDPNTGWPTCYGDRCDKPATKLGVNPRSDGSGIDTEPVCADCSKKYSRSRTLSAPLLETWKKTDNESAEPDSFLTKFLRLRAGEADKRDVDLNVDANIHTVNPISFSKSRPRGTVKRITDADEIKDPVTRAGARAARRRALDSNTIIQPKRRVRIANRTSEPTGSETGPVTAIERDRLGLMGMPTGTPGRPAILPTNIEAITGSKGGALAALGTTIAEDYRKTALDELHKRRSPAEGDAILEAALEASENDGSIVKTLARKQKRKADWQKKPGKSRKKNAKKKK